MADAARSNTTRRRERSCGRCWHRKPRSRSLRRELAADIVGRGTERGDHVVEHLDGSGHLLVWGTEPLQVVAASTTMKTGNLAGMESGLFGKMPDEGFVCERSLRFVLRSGHRQPVLPGHRGQVATARARNRAGWATRSHGPSLLAGRSAIRCRVCRPRLTGAIQTLECRSSPSARGSSRSTS